MARIKSLITRVAIDSAKRAHNCQANACHRIEADELRLNVRNGRSWDRYCFTCALTILERDLKKMREIKTQLDEKRPAVTS